MKNKCLDFQDLPQPDDIVSLVDVLRLRAELQPKSRAFLFLEDRGHREHVLTYGELYRLTENLAGHLEGFTQAGDRVVLFFPPGLDYIVAFLACLRAGLVAVPLYPPRPNQRFDRLSDIFCGCGAQLALTIEKQRPRLEAFFAALSEGFVPQLFSTDQLPEGSAHSASLPRKSDLAFLQYTSGSTGAPKGVMVSHGNLMANQAAITRALDIHSEDVALNWLPLYHDMGLIGTVLNPLYQGYLSVIMPSISFIRDPLSWLELISRYKATVAGGPCFAYALCVVRAVPERLAALDLSAWRLAFNGAEPVHAQTLQKFAETFEPFGFRSQAAYPCYGLAEATLLISGGVSGSGPTVLHLDRERLRQNKVEITRPRTSSLPVVGCGFRQGNGRLEVVDPKTRCLLPNGSIGEIWVSGDHVAQGYWNQPRLSQATFAARLAGEERGSFLRTGDLGFLDRDQLFLTGRLKQLIIVRGRNHHPGDIEQTASASHPALAAHAAAAFCLELDGEERLILVQEIARHEVKGLDHGAVIAAMRTAVAEEHELRLNGVALLRPGSLQKTSSGKIIRYAARQAYQDGSLAVLGESLLQAAAGERVELDRDSLLAEKPEQRPALLLSWLTDRAARLLHVNPDQLGPEQTMTSFGLDSLRAVELQNTFETELGLYLPMARLLESSSIGAIVHAVLATPGEAPVLAPAHVEPVFPLSHNQLAMWFLYRLAPKSSAYNLAHAVRIRSGLDAQNLRHAFEKIFARHACLRTTFHQDGERIWQQVHENPVLPFEVIDTTAWDPARIDGYLDHLARRPFDLNAKPPLDIKLLEMGTGGCILFINLHHITVDFWSFLILMDELGRFYAGRGKGLPELTSSFADYVVRRRLLPATEEGKRLRDWWTHHLQGAPLALDLPLDHPRPKLQTYNGASFSILLQPHLLASLNLLAQTQETTLYTVLLSAFQVLLQCYTGQQDFVIGSPTLGRDRADLDGVIGYFANPVCLHADLSGSPTFLTLVDRCRREVLDVLAHAAYPFSLLVEELKPRRDPTRSPLFQVMFVLQRAHRLRDAAAFALGQGGSRMELGGLELESVALENHSALFDLNLVAAETEAGLVAAFEYNTDLFDSITIERLASNFEVLLQRLVAEPEKPIAQLTWLSADEASILSSWAGRSGPGPSKNFHRRFENQAAHFPDMVALVRGQQTFTYGLLNGRANRLAYRLIESGVGSEQVVGVCLERGADLIAALLAVLKAGAAYLPLDPGYPDSRLAHMSADANLVALISRPEQAHKLNLDVPLLDPEIGSSDLEYNNPKRFSHREQLAYVLYTSGSSGQPKGVAVRHGAVAQMIDWAGTIFPERAWRGTLASTSVNFDLSVFEIFGPLCHGGTLFLVKDVLQLAGPDRPRGVTLINTVPTAIAELLRLDAIPETAAFINLAGEPLSRQIVDALYSLPGVDRVTNLYGPSEDTTYSTHSIVPAAILEPPSIGRPITNTRAYVLDKNLRQPPIGVPGELCLSGAGLARGYLNRPRMTAAVFVPDPCPTIAGGRLYKTGDRARWLPDGVLAFLGRSDHQVKYRGFRIELAEIETMLDRCPGVERSLVLVREDPKQLLTAYLTPVQAENPDTDDLRTILASLLPAYMVPAVFVVLERFPLTAHGKIDRSALPAPAYICSERSYLAPRTPTETRLAAEWEELLAVPRVGLSDDFFELGGHSLLATRLVVRLRESFGVIVPVAALFEFPTVAGLATYIDAAEVAEAGPELLALARDPQFDLPLSFIQEGFWLAQQIHSQGSRYNMPSALRFSGPLDVSALEETLRRLVNRHEVLRTNFQSVDNRPIQVIHPVAHVVLPVFDLSATSDPSWLAAVFIKRQVRRFHFDLSQGPLLRFVLLRLADETHTLLLLMHHIVADAWSVAVLSREVTALYSALLRGSDADLPAPGIQYADYAAWQRQWYESPAAAAQLAWWQNQLADMPPVLRLPPDKVPRGPHDHRPGTRTLVLAPALRTRLEAISLTASATLFMTLLAAFKLLIARHTERDDVIIGVTSAGRGHARTENMVGCFLNVLPLRTNFRGNPSFAELLTGVRQTALTSFAHGDLPFDKLINQLPGQGEPDRPPVFDILFNMVNTPKTNLNLPGLDLRFGEVAEQDAKYSMTLFGLEGEKGLELRLVYRLGLYSAAKMDNFMDQFQHLLEQLAAERGIRDISLVDVRAASVLPNPAEPLAADRFPGVIETFLDVAARFPERPALIRDGKTRSYTQVLADSEDVARVLANHGQVVALHGRPCFGLAVGLLGIQRAGRTLLTLASDLPAARKQAILRQAGAACLLCVEGVEVPRTELPVVSLDQNGRPLEKIPSGLLEPARVDNPAYIFFTSGTSGSPKAILGTHLGLAHFIDWQRTRYHIDETDRVGWLSGLSFDALLRDVYLPLCSGAALCLPGSDHLLSGRHILTWLSDNKVSVVHTVPSVAGFWLDDVPEGLDLTHLRYLFFSGEPLFAALVNCWRACLGQRTTVVNFYGPTETTMIKCAWTVPADPLPGIQPVGFPLPGAQALVLTPTGLLAASGEPGEIVLRTPYGTLGYLNDPEATRQRFVQNPFSGEADDLLYFTGDRGRYQADGTLEILGRLDDQVKIRGVRIEPTEVAAMLASHEDVGRAAVFARVAESGEKRLLAYYTAANALPENEELRLFMAERLPGAMVPAAFIYLEAMPLLANGKVNRAALPDPDSERGAFRAPTTPFQHRMAALWAQLFKLPRVGLDENFFHLGGHSLLAVDLVSQVRKSFANKVSLYDIFDNPVLADFCERLQGMENGDREAIPAIRHEAGWSGPLSFGQQRLWLVDRLADNSSAYNISTAIHIIGNLDLTVLQRAVDRIFARHESPRTVFFEGDGKPMQRVKGPRSVEIPVLHLGDDPLTRLRQEIDREALAPFNLERGPLLRLRLLSLNNEEQVLLVTLHHIVTDGFSAAVLVDELMTLYGACAEDRVADLAELPIQYGDYAQWQRNWVKGEECARQLNWWSEQLTGAPPLMDLPRDRSRPAFPSSEGGRVKFSLDAATSNALRQLGRQNDATSFMTLYAVFALLLFRYGSGEDVVIGTPFANRNREELENLIGFFVNPLVLRTDLSGDPSFCELLGRVCQVALGAFSHCDLPFDQLVERLTPKRSGSTNPLFQVLFVMQDNPVSRIKIPGQTWRVLDQQVFATKFDLTLGVVPGDEGFDCYFEYLTDVFDARTITRLADHFSYLAGQVGLDPNRPLSKFPLEKKTEIVWQSWEQPRALVHQLFEQQAETRPEEVAIRFEGGETRYGRLNARANRIAHKLAGRVTQPVAVMLHTGPDQIAAVLGTLKAGGAFVGLDLNWPSYRLGQVLHELEPGWILSDHAAYDQHRDLFLSLATTTRRLVLDDAEDPLAGLSESNPDLAATPQDSCYLVYTSGSTGRPKGIEQTHAGLVQFSSWFADRFAFGPGKRIGNWASLAYDAAYYEIFGALCSGATLCMLTKSGEPGAVLAWLRRERIQVIKTVPTFARQLLVQIEAADVALPHLAFFLLAGEVLAVDFAQAWYARFPRGARLFNLYGPSETILATVYPVDQLAPDRRAVPIGKAIEGRQILILDPALQPCPVGIRGEIYIRTPFLGRGYFHNSQETAARYIQNPLNPRPGDRVFRTGDMGRFLHNGNIEFGGRLDGQVKIHGQRVELGEIEAVLERHVSVAQAAAAPRVDRLGELRIFAYVVTNQDLEDTDLFKWARDRLPGHMVPAGFTWLSSLPYTASGKLDRKSLPEPVDLVAVRGYTPPRTSLEEILVSTFADVLNLKRIGVHDNFFQLGGHSLMATQVVSRIRERLEVEVRLRDVFAAATPAELSQVVRRLEDRRASRPAIEPIERVDTGEVIAELAAEEPPPIVLNMPLSFAQQRLWFLDRLHGKSSTDNLFLALRIDGRLNEGLLASAFSELMERHETLRTTYHEVRGEPRQAVHAPKPVVLKVRDLSDLEPETRQARTLELAQEERNTPFNLSHDLPLRLSLLRLGQDLSLLLLSKHHIASDGWSFGILYRELVILYKAFARGEPSPLEELEIQYADFAAWQRGRLQGQTLELARSYWRQELENLPLVHQLPTDRPRLPIQSNRSARLAFHIEPRLTTSLKSLGQKRGATLFMVLETAFAVLLERYSGQRDLAVGTPIANRNQAQLETLIGFFANSLVLRNDLSGNPSFDEMLARVKEKALAAYDHQDLPFEDLVDMLKPERSLAHAPLFQVMFAMGTPYVQAVDLEGLRLSQMEVPCTRSMFDLTLSINEDPDGLSGGWDYATDLFDKSTIDRYSSHFRVLLEGIVADSDRPISRLPIMEPLERKRVLDVFNRRGRAYDTSQTVLDLIAKQVRQQGGAPALEDAEGHIFSRARLNARQKQLAAYLHARGVGPRSFVAVCLPRGTEALLFMLAVLETGAAYLPLDPDYPEARLRHMLRDSKARLLVRNEQGPKISGVAPDELDPAHVPAEYPATRLDRPGPSQLAYLIYTSGSTGQPKGVMITHANLANHARAIAEAYKLKVSDRILQFATLSFDVAGEEIYPTLAAGATLVLRPNDPHLDLAAFHDFATRRRLTAVNLPAAFWHEWVDALQDLPVPECLRLVVVGSDKVRTVKLAAWRRQVDPRVTWFNAYGLTEATITNSLHCADDRPEPDALVAIGRPVANTSHYILDRNGSPLPVGTLGELYIGGAGIARGYLDRPAQTALAFVPDPYAKQSGARLYRSGDRARYRADGTVAFLGRADDQLKVRGFRIELGEVESVLNGHPHVVETVVLALTDEEPTRLIAFVQSREEGLGVEVENLRAYLGERLPEYMIPAEMVLVAAIPRFPGGKLDRTALAALRPDQDLKGYLAPEGRIEAILATIWSKLLGLERVGREDNFFALGGDSILTIQVVAQAREAGLRLTPKQLFEKQTVAGLALLAVPVVTGVDREPLTLAPDSDAYTPSDFPLADINQHQLDLLLAGRQVADLYCLTPMQEGMHFHALHDPGGHYFDQTCLDLIGAFDLPAFKQAWAEAIKRHQPLAVSFHWQNLDKPLQMVQRDIKPPFAQLDWSDLAEREQEQSLLALLAEDHQRGFKLDQAPLWRLTLIRLGPDLHKLVLSHHHIILDGWSVPNLFREVLALYEAYRLGRLPEPPRAKAYRNYISWPRNQDLKRAREFWQGQLAGFESPTPLPHIGGKPHGSGPTHGLRRISLSKQETEALNGLARHFQLTPNILVQAAWALLLSRYSRENDVVFGAVVSGRGGELVGMAPMIGMFINTLPVRVKINETDSMRDWLARQHTSQVEREEFAYTPLVDIKGWSLVPGRQALFDSLFAFENYPMETISQSEGLEIKVEKTEESTHYPLALIAVPGQELTLKLHHAYCLLDEAAAQRLLRHLTCLLEDMTRRPDSRLGDLDMLAPEERSALLREAVAPAPLPEAGLNELFESWVVRYPDSTALAYGGEEMSYGELDEKAEELAAALQEMGVGPDVVVAIFLERTPELIASLLAVLKAGAAFMILDLTYPDERLAFMLADTGSPLVLTRPHLVERLPKRGMRIVDVASIADTGRFRRVYFFRAYGASIAYVIYTSGSTGRPKGVIVPHAGLGNLSEAQIRHLELDRDSRVLQCASVGFDTFVWEILMALGAGGRLHLVDPADLLPGEPLAQILRLQQITHLTLTPSSLSQLPAGDYPHLRVLVTVGEACTSILADTWSKGQTFVNGYGPSEATICATIETVSPEGRDPAIGLPLDHVRVKILDHRLQPVPKGVPGELCIAAPGLARGYLGRPALTAEKFLPDPFTSVKGSRIYRTGDLSAWRKDNKIKYLGRLDNQIKLRGFRIEPGEIETRLRQYEGVRDALVLNQKRGESDEGVDSEPRLVAYLQLEKDGRIKSGKLRAALRKNLPEYMVPAAFVYLESFPRTTSGKLDRRALAALTIKDETETYIASRNETEAGVATILAKVLGIERIGIDANFFDMGGHSLMATRIISELRNEFETNIPVAGLFEDPTVTGLAKLVETAS